MRKLASLTFIARSSSTLSKANTSSLHWLPICITHPSLRGGPPAWVMWVSGFDETENCAIKKGWFPFCCIDFILNPANLAWQRHRSALLIHWSSLFTFQFNGPKRVPVVSENVILNFKLCSGTEDILMVIRYPLLIKVFLEEMLEKLLKFFAGNVSPLT